ncbi:MAG TPA: MFS transporter [Steroidobacteraceae bacterium]|nr:MFS transporter [Steroidobacteraceae bacterium]
MQSAESQPVAVSIRTRTDLAAVALAFLIIMVDGFDLQAIGYVAPEIALTWSVPLSGFGPVFAAALAGSIVGALMAGLITRRIGLRISLAFALLLFGALTLSTPWATSLSTLGALRLFAGVGLGAAVPIAVGLVARRSASQWRATFMTLTLCGQPIGAILGGALCTRLIPLYGWQSAFYLGGVLPLLLATALSWLSPRDGERTDSTDGSSPAVNGRFVELFNSDLRMTTLILPGCAFVSSGFLYIIINWLPGVMRGAGYSLSDSVLAVSVFNFGGIFGGLAGARFMDRFGPFKVLSPLYVIAALSTGLLGPLIADRSLLLVAACISGLAGYGAALNLGPLAVMLYPPTLHTLGIGWALGVGRLGAVIGPWAVGLLLAAGFATGHLFYVAAAATLTAVVCLSTLAGTGEF